MQQSNNQHTDTRIESDSMGQVRVPKDALWRAQTERARQNFQLSNLQFPIAFIHTLAHIKAAAADANFAAKVISEQQANAIHKAVEAILSGQADNAFPLDIFQTGSGTSTNMNINEVIASLAEKLCDEQIHPNDHVNASQSSNDVIPTAILVSSVLSLRQRLLPALAHLKQTIESKAKTLTETIKTGRTHLMDAMPLSMAQELRAWSTQLEHVESGLNQAVSLASNLPQGGTAIGSGINAPEHFGERFCRFLSQRTATEFRASSNPFAGIAGQEVNLMLSGQLNALSAVLMKISNDLRWMNSGPLAGLGEISLKALQPGSSIMPGKVNPVIPEAVAMVCAQVAGNHHTVSIAAQQGNFQLNVMLPVIAFNQLQSIELLSNAAHALADSAIAEFTVNHNRLNEALAKNPILVTALNREIGYNKAAEIAKQAYQQQRPILEVAIEMTDIPKEKLEQLLNPKNLI
ncbi:class II fumarate hydratase [Pseudidiomarina marina]|uniref:fumarate hydratase n=1 Tax=Pseudidiomarina marina TaxID=502366 RepID=A0A432YKJ4_9GAMM|nr:class II fumarate hydratase [Pseudidiomarina marina]RUO61497.1 aspartate ammonia-lyase [Pseudidiomarina marina]